MSVEYLDVELTELGRQRKKLSQAQLNKWFDGSPIKSRLKKAFLKIQRLRCCYCRRLDEDHHNRLWELDHVLCEKIYPQLFVDTNNLSVSCTRCNGAKVAKDVLAPGQDPSPKMAPVTAEAYTIPHPLMTNWSDHLRHTNYIIYEGVSKEGKRLVDICELNGKAEEMAGFTPGAINAAKANKIFEIFSSRLPGLTRELALEMALVADEHTEQLRENAAMRRLNRAYGSYEKKVRSAYA